MPVGHPVGADDPDPDLSAGIGDHAEGALDRVRRLVMVDDRRASALEGLEGAEHGRPPDHLLVEGAVEPPPDQLEDLDETTGCPRWSRHSPGEGGVEVMVGADQPTGGGHWVLPRSMTPRVEEMSP